MGAITGWVILGVIIIAGIIAGISGREGSRWIGWAVAALAAVIEAIVIITTMMVTVGSSDIGVITSFGKPAGDLTPGVHWLSPTASVTIWDGSIQTISYDRNSCLNVKIGGGQSACLTLTFTYQLRADSVDAMFIQYRTQAAMQDKLVLRALDQAINTQLQNYSPITEIAKGSLNPTSMVPFIQPILTQMQQDVGGSIIINPQHSLVMPYVTFDDRPRAG